MAGGRKLAQALFFQLVNDRGGADAQDTCCVADPTAIEAHVDDLLLNVWKTPFVCRIQQKGRARAVGILAPIALFPGIGFAAFHHPITLTVGTKNRHEYHCLPPSPFPLQKEASAWHTCQRKSRSETLPYFYINHVYTHQVGR